MTQHNIIEKEYLENDLSSKISLVEKGFKN